MSMFHEFSLAVEPTYFTNNLFSWIDCPNAPATQDLSYGHTDFTDMNVSIYKLRATLESAKARVQTRTLAQQLLDATHDEEAAEIFSRIALTQASGGILSPSPTRATFPTFAPPMGLALPGSPLSSRPSSPASSYSGSSALSDVESSISTAPSSIPSPSYASRNLQKRITLEPIARPSAPAPGYVPSVRSAPQVALARPHATRVVPTTTTPKAKPATAVVDANKKDVTKYLYQGGVSTVLTGGVMLGRPSGNGNAPKTSTTPKYRAPIGGRSKTCEATVTSWRRMVVAHV